MCKIEYKLIELITLYRYLISIENFDVYKKILSKYEMVLKDNTLNNFSSLENVFRLYLEAPPKDKILGEYILNKMQDFYEDYSKIEESS